MADSPASVLRKFVIPREVEERCDVCGASLPADHAHQFDPATRVIRCACHTCRLLSAKGYRDVPRDVHVLLNFRMADAQWEGLRIPISLAFFVRNSSSNKMMALYPGPAGAAESLLPLDAWQDIAAANPELQRMLPDVEALLVNRVGSTRDYFVAPIDQCYKLVGIIRTHWRGLSGGSRVWGEVAQFFDRLRQRAENAGRSYAAPEF